MSRRRKVILAVLLVVVAAYLVHDWSRPCLEGPAHRFVEALLHGGSVTVRCAG